MEFKKISAPSLKELFVEQLESKILSGELKVGDKLPSERELAQSMQVSRAVVNAGIAEMEQKGFLDIQPRVGTFVADYRKHGSLETLVSIMKYNGGTLANDEIRAVLELRIQLIQLATRLAMTQASQYDLNGLREYMDRIKKSKSHEALVQNTFALTHELGYISGNALLPLLFTSFKELVCMLWQRYIMNYGAEALIRSNEKFVDLVLSGDVEAAIKYVETSTYESIDGEKLLYF